jgi:hypothetical protein
MTWKRNGKIRLCNLQPHQLFINLKKRILQIVFFATGNGIWPPFCHFCHFLVSTWNLCSKAEFLVSKLVCFAIRLDTILPE